MSNSARGICLLLLTAAILPAHVIASDLGGAQWIWSSKYGRINSPAGSLYFRKVFEVTDPVEGRVEIVCDDAYDLFINGARVGGGNDWRIIGVHDVTGQLHAGRNIVAVHAKNAAKGPASLVACVRIRERNGGTLNVLTDGSWKFSEKAAPLWQQATFDDSGWISALAEGPFGQVNPWGDQPQLAGGPTSLAQRFTAPPGFSVEEVIKPGHTGSLVAMAFDADGNILASREEGPLLLLRDTDRDGNFETVATFCDKLQNCQGILPLDGDVFAVGHGPEGSGLYRLSDADRNGKAEQVLTLLKFTFPMAEHGPHAVALGRDGSIYVMVGNHARTQRAPDKRSPLHGWYDVDLLKPKYEDANGHAAGIKAPGGIVVRTDRDASFIEYFAGGFRNAYDLAFNRAGEILTYDSDMEYDVGLPWYRPTRVNLVTQGSEFGWRSGWAKWPDYYLDSLPAVLELGRGSPTGIEHYDHMTYPAKYQDAMFMCDWSRGRVLAVMKMQPSGEYASEAFLEGRPLNCSDCAVGPDGCLYICVGGRGTQGSIFRVVYGTRRSSSRSGAARSVEHAIDQPQIMSAWGRKAVLAIKQSMKENWEPKLTEFIQNQAVRGVRRAKALDVLQLFGPPPKPDLLLALTKDGDAAVRRKATYLLGVHAFTEGTSRLVELLADPVPGVARSACDALARVPWNAPGERIVPLLNSEDRYTRWAARRALEQQPVAEWKQHILNTSQPRIFTHGAIGLLVIDPSRQTAEAILTRCRYFLPPWRRAFAELSDVVELLRVVEVALERGKLEPQELPKLSAQLAAMYPTKDWRANRELATLLTFFQDPHAAELLVQQLGTDIPLTEKIHIAMRMPFLKRGWTPELRRLVLKFLEHARTQEGGNSFRGYLTNATNDFLKPLSPDERLALIVEGAEMPAVTLGLVQKLPKQLAAKEQRLLRQLDRDLTGRESNAAAELRQALISRLARGTRESRAYVRLVFENSPQRRNSIVRVVAGDAREGQDRREDWPLLVQSLKFVEGNTARDVLLALTNMEAKSNSPQDYSRVILLGMRLGDEGGLEAVRLMEHWTGKKLPSTPAENALSAWRNWFVQTFPDLPAPSVPAESVASKWTFSQLIDYLSSRTASRGSVQRGAKIFEKARCITCHKYGSRGEGIGPDLTNVSRRFQPKEILESVMFPSLVISDQYQSKMVLANGKTYVGIVGPTATGIVVHQSNGEKVEIDNDEIEELILSKASAMPEGLFNPLSLQEIADLFAYLAQPPAGQ